MSIRTVHRGRFWEKKVDTQFKAKNNGKMKDSAVGIFDAAANAYKSLIFSSMDQRLSCWVL